MHLFQPRKQGNIDCTFCLDCVHACPHGNVGLLAVVPGGSLWSDSPASGIGRLTKRRDIGLLVLVLVCGAFANAAGMIGPVAGALDQLSSATGTSRFAMVSMYYALALIALPLAAMAVVGALARRWGNLSSSWLDVAARYCYALVPLGFGMWLAHYSFHLLASYGTVVPAAQRFAQDLGVGWPGEPEWQRACCVAVAQWIPHFEIMALDFGMLLSMYVGYRIALTEAARGASAPTPRECVEGNDAVRLADADVICRRRVDCSTTDGDARIAAAGRMIGNEYPRLFDVTKAVLIVGLALLIGSSCARRWPIAGPCNGRTSSAAIA